MGIRPATPPSLTSPHSQFLQMLHVKMQKTSLLEGGLRWEIRDAAPRRPKHRASVVTTRRASPATQPGEGDVGRF